MNLKFKKKIMQLRQSYWLINNQNLKRKLMDSHVREILDDLDKRLLKGFSVNTPMISLLRGHPRPFTPPEFTPPGHHAARQSWYEYASAMAIKTIPAQDIPTWKWRKGESPFDYMIRLQGIVGSVNCWYWHHARVVVVEIKCGTGMGFKVRKEIPVEKIEASKAPDQLLCVAMEQAAAEITKANSKP